MTQGLLNIVHECNQGVFCGVHGGQIHGSLAAMFDRLLDRDDSPWYASVRLYRQGADRQWQAVLVRVAEALRHLIGQHA